MRPGIYSTFQDIGFKNTQHLGVTTSGVMDPFLFFIANTLVGRGNYLMTNNKSILI